MNKLMTMIQDSLYDVMRPALDTIGYEDVEIAYANENALEPKRTYCVVNILNIAQVGGKDEATYITGEDILETVTPYRLNTQFSFIGKSSGDVGFDFRHNIINNRECYEHFQRGGWGFLARGDLRRVPQPRETGWMDAQNMDIDLSFAVQTRQAYDWVEYITVNGEVYRIWNDE